MEKTGDPVLDYLKELIEYIRQRGVDWRMPKNFAQYPEEDQRDYIWNLQEACDAITNFCTPLPPQNIMQFVLGGPRPEITG